MSLDGSGGMAMAYTARKFHRENMKILTATTTVGGGIEENGGGYTRWFFGKLSTKKKSAKRVSLSEHANHLRKQTLKQMSRILTTKQAARGFLALGEYFQRLRALREENKEKRSTRKKSQLPRVMLTRDLFIWIVAFEREYRLSLEEQNRRVNEIQTALQAHISDTEVQLLVDSCLNHYTNLFRIKADAARADACYLVSGGWQTSTERLFQLIGGFRPSELLNCKSPLFICYSIHSSEHISRNASKNLLCCCFSLCCHTFLH
ncbi:hypothetical protein YC2023_083875 [Brassica napus]|uniref:(rape) hypothetical protein n=1 Tax=Brassica napus TaxID=3708 RepID=A0A816MMS8_BRANA|nr:unnamed protein product [Brassica napus]